METGKVNKFKPECFIIDVDGVFTDGSYYYSVEGKVLKKFGPHDNDGIKLLRDKIKIQTITADHRGFEITKKRIHTDMNLSVALVSESDRLSWLNKNFLLKNCIYMGDGIHDIEIFKNVGYSIAPNNAFYLVKEKADFVTKTDAGRGAVLEACLHINDKFFPEKVKKFPGDL